jgi:hypothetical protein
MENGFLQQQKKFLLLRYEFFVHENYEISYVALLQFVFWRFV